MHATSEFLPTALWSGKLFDGQWQSGASTQDVIEPATGTALGQIARRHGRLNTETVLPALENVRRRMPSLQGVIADTIDDIEMFT